MSETVIPQSSKQKHPGENQKYVNSRAGGPAEHSRTKQQSIKHQNPEYFKRQADKKDENSENVGRGSGQVGRDSRKKDMSNENVGRGIGCVGANQHKDKGRDVGRGVGQVGRDSKKKR